MQTICCIDAKSARFRKAVTSAGIKAPDDTMIADMMLATTKQPAKIRLNSMYSRTCAAYGNSLASEFYKTLEPVFMKQLFPNGFYAELGNPENVTPFKPSKKKLNKNK